jgi:hypothetical protein
MTIFDALLALDLQIPVSHEAVRKAFRSKAKQFHPDKFRDPTLHREASNQFILARKAYDFLLSLSVESINHPTAIRPTEPIVRRARRPQTPMAKVVEHPFLKDLDNAARLFHFISETGISKPFWKRLMKLNLSPGVLMGNLYERWIEKAYNRDKQWHGIVYAIFKFIRLLIGAIFLIASFLFISIAGLGIMTFLFPSGLAFLAVYMSYNVALDFLKDHQLRKKPNPKNLFSKQLRSLIFKTTILVFCALLCQTFILLARNGTYYIQTLSWVFALLFLVPVLGTIYEWTVFYRKK